MLLFYLKTGVKQIWFVFTVFLLYAQDRWPVNVVAELIPRYDDDDSYRNKSNNNVNDRFFLFLTRLSWEIYFVRINAVFSTTEKIKNCFGQSKFFQTIRNQQFFNNII